MNAAPYTINRPARPAAPRRKATEEQTAAAKAKRDALKNISQMIQAVRGPEGDAHLALMGTAQAAIFEQFTNREAFPTVNTCLEHLYTLETGFSCWKTFAGWRAEGYCVKKGETGRAVWGTPREMIHKNDDGDEETGKEWFPISYLFNSSQVEEIITEYGNAIQSAAALQQLGTDKTRRAQLLEETHGAEAVQHLQTIGAL